MALPLRFIAGVGGKVLPGEDKNFTTDGHVAYGGPSGALVRVDVASLDRTLVRLDGLRAFRRLLFPRRFLGNARHSNRFCGAVAIRAASLLPIRLSHRVAVQILGGKKLIP